MKMTKLLFVVIPLGFAGCVYSHRAPVVYAPPSTTTVVAPVSDRPVVRVYPYPTTVETLPPVTTTQVVPTSSDLAMADTIRKMFDADPSFSSATKDVQIGVYHGTVTLRGSVPLHETSDELQRRIQTIPGVAQVDNQLDVTLH